MKSLDEQILDKVYEILASDEAKENIKKSTISTLDKYGIVPGVQQIEVKKLNGEFKKAGKQHKKFKTILEAISAKVNIALVGPAGSGKTTAVANCADALDLKFYSKSVSLQTGVHEFFGYQDAHGKYVKTLFREAYENGGVFLLDEFDAGNPNVLAALNQATANKYCAFADGMINKHEDFVVVMAGNTYGHGATSEYVGRNKIDAATLDRFAFITFEYDEDLEMDLAANKAWCKTIQDVRKLVEEKKVKTIISPRATFDGEKLLAVGMKAKEVIDLIIYKGLNEQERNLIKVSYNPPTKAQLKEMKRLQMETSEVVDFEEVEEKIEEKKAEVQNEETETEIESIRKKIDRDEKWLENKKAIVDSIEDDIEANKLIEQIKKTEIRVSKYYAKMIELTSN